MYIASNKVLLNVLTKKQKKFVFVKICIMFVMKFNPFENKYIRCK